MPDNTIYLLWDTSQPKAAPVTVHQATGYLVTFEYRTALGTIPSWDYFDRLEGEEGALEAYERPGKGYTGKGISACRGGVPFAELDMQTIHSITQEARQDKRDDDEHTRLFGRGGL